MAPTVKPKVSDRLLLRMSVNRKIDGLWVGTVESGPILCRVEESLQLIKIHDRRRYDRLLRDLDRVWVRLLPGDVACFNAALWACELDTRFVLQQSPEFIAAAIVHEATHARLWRSGVTYDESSRHRIETICARQELAFAAKLPNGEKVREWAEAALSQPPALTDMAFGERFQTGSIEALGYRRVPQWLVRTLLAVQALRLGITRAFRNHIRRR